VKSEKKSWGFGEGGGWCLYKKVKILFGDMKYMLTFVSEYSGVKTAKTDNWQKKRLK
jgi:hypothetical protein